TEGGGRAGAGGGADLVGRGSRRDEAVARAPSVGRVEPHRPAEGGGQADRAASVGAESGRRDAARDRDAASPARAAGHALRVPWVPGGAEGGVLGRRSHGELVEVRLPQDERAGLAQARDDGGVVGGG